jgi:3-oxoadipate enol-lactonase
MTTLATSLGNIGYCEQGSDGVPLVFLHGVGSDKSAWDPQLVHFGASRRTIAFDYPGYGESDPLVERSGAPHDQFAEAILAALDALDLYRVHLCGLSLGGVVAIAIAHRAPARLASLIIADSFARHPDGAAIADRSLAASSDMTALANARIPHLLGADPDEELVAQLVEVMANIDPAAFRFASHAVWLADQRDRARAISVPTLLTCGDSDRVTPGELSEELATLIDGSRFVLIAGAGHLPNLEQPADFDATIQSFLSVLEGKMQGYRPLNHGI